MWRRNQYLYRSFRDPATGKTRKRYLGAGEFAERLAEYEEQWERACRAEKRARLEIALIDLGLISEDVQLFLDRADDIGTAALLVTDHRQHKRNTWHRAKRKEWAMSTAALPPPKAKYSYEQRRAALECANHRDADAGALADALPILREIARDPRSCELMGGTPARLRREIRDYCYGKTHIRNAALEEMAVQHRDELLGGKSTPLERTLADAIVTAKHYHDGLLSKLVTTQEMDRRLMLALERQISEANKRFLASCKMLATIRRLQVPQLIQQINIGTKQQIVGSATSTSPTPKPRRRARKTIAIEPAQTPAPAIGAATTEETP